MQKLRGVGALVVFLGWAFSCAVSVTLGASGEVPTEKITEFFERENGALAKTLKFQVAAKDGRALRVVFDRLAAGETVRLAADLKNSYGVEVDAEALESDVPAARALVRFYQDVEGIGERPGRRTAGVVRWGRMSDSFGRQPGSSKKWSRGS